QIQTSSMSQIVEHLAESKNIQQGSEQQHERRLQEIAGIQDRCLQEMQHRMESFQKTIGESIDKLHSTLTVPPVQQEVVSRSWNYEDVGCPSEFDEKPRSDSAGKSRPFKSPTMPMSQKQDLVDEDIPESFPPQRKRPW
ncbi:unnamed protein product, partial [Owenia fusiformis]